MLSTTSQGSDGNSAHIPNRQWVIHPNQPIVFEGGRNHLQHMDEDLYADICNSENLYYPFASESEWEVANWLSSGTLSQNNIDNFLHLQHVSTHSLSCLVKYRFFVESCLTLLFQHSKGSLFTHRVTP